MSRAALRHVLQEVARRNRVREGLLYMQVTRGVARRDHAFPSRPVPPSVVVTIRRIPPYPTDVTRWTASAITHPGPALGALRHQEHRAAAECAGAPGGERARRAGGDPGRCRGDGDGRRRHQFLDRRQGGRAAHPQLDHAILPGCTRDALMRLMRDEGIGFEESRFSVQDMRDAREAFISSATSFVKPIVQHRRQAGRRWRGRTGDAALVRHVLPAREGRAAQRGLTRRSIVANGLQIGFNLPISGPMATPDGDGPRRARGRGAGFRLPHPDRPHRAAGHARARLPVFGDPANSTRPIPATGMEQLTAAAWIAAKTEQDPAGAGGDGGAASPRGAGGEDAGHDRRAVRWPARGRHRRRLAEGGVRRGRHHAVRRARRGHRRISRRLPHALDRRTRRGSPANTSTSTGCWSIRSRCRSRTRRSGSAAKAARRCAAPPGSATRGIRSAATRPTCWTRCRGWQAGIARLRRADAGSRPRSGASRRRLPRQAPRPAGAARHRRTSQTVHRHDRRRASRTSPRYGSSASPRWISTSRGTTPTRPSRR